MTYLNPKHENTNVVTPLKNGGQLFYHCFNKPWIPASAGMTACKPHKPVLSFHFLPAETVV
jgi:hypothetical protein